MSILQEGTLLAQLVPRVDDIRRRLAARTGARPQEVTLVKRGWSGGEVGVGSVDVLDSLTLDPPPVVEIPLRPSALHYLLAEHGQVEVGDLRLTEVSLTYDEEQLTGGIIALGQEVYYRVAAPGTATSFYRLLGRPRPDTTKTIGWVINLAVMSNFQE